MSVGSLLLQQICCASREGRFGSSLATDIKVHLADPFKQSVAGQSTTMAAIKSPSTGAAGSFAPALATTQKQEEQQFAFLGVIAEGSEAQVGGAGVVKEHVAKARALLTLLLLCGEPERLAGVNEVVGVIASGAAANIVQFIKSEISSAALLLPGHSHASSVFVAHDKWNPVLLAAQSLLLLTRHFQMQRTFVRSICGLLELLMEEVRRHTQNSAVSMALLNENPTTAGVCAVTWLVTVSLINTLAVWQDLRDATGEAKPNILLSTDVAAEVEEWVAKLRSKLEHSQTMGYLSFAVSGQGSSGQTRQHLPGNPALHNDHGQKSRWLTIVHGYISMVILAVGVFLCAKGDERGLDKAVEAFVGDRSQFPNSMYRGKVMKRFVQLAPAQSLLVIPLENIYIIPYDIASRMFDEMLPAVRHVADIDVLSSVRYLEALQTGLEGIQEDKGGFATAAATGVTRLQQQQQQYGVGLVMRERGESFFSEIPHILQALTVCLENLPSEVLNSDIGLDCAVTHFIFTNCLLHLKAVFCTQRSNTLWEPYTVKLVTSFLDVLVMIGRNPQHTERVLDLFSERQVECAELQWSSLIGQAREYTGVSGGMTLLMTPDVGIINTTALRNPVRGAGLTRHRQFTAEYLFAKQQAYVASLFLLLRQLAIHPRLFDEEHKYMKLDVALNFFFAPRLLQPVLGKALSLIASLIKNHSDASRVWTFLEENNLLRPATATQARKQQGDLGTLKERVATTDADGDTAVTVEARSLLGHCQYECHHGTYSITIGFLDLILALLKYHVPEVEHVPRYTGVIRFIAEEIFRGVLRRFFSSNDERYTVVALASAVLNRALSMRLAFSTNNSMIPFTVVMACSKAPSDVLGEALQIIAEASVATNELNNYQRAAVRQCLAMLENAIRVKQEQGLDSVFTFDAKTASNTELAAQLLPLSASADSLLARKALQLLLLLPNLTLSQAVQHWFSQPNAQESVITPFVTALRIEAVSGPIIYAPPTLAVLDHEELHLMFPHAEVEIKSLIMDLLIQNARAPQPSITSWLCGYPLYGPSEELLAGYCLEPVIAGANSGEVEERHPHIAVKYVKLLYLLRANFSLNTPGLQRLMKRRGNLEMFYVLQTLQVDQCPPLILSKYAFVMQLLALDILSIGTKGGYKINNSLHSMNNSTLVDLLFVLLHLSSSGAMSLRGDEFVEQSALGYRRNDNNTAVDFAEWPSLCLKSLPLFPTNCTAPGGIESYVVCQNEGGAPQYSIPMLYEALQRESLANNKRSLSIAELRERLCVFVRANECLEAYAGGVQFIEGWCSLVNISVTVFDIISEERILFWTRCILESVQYTSSLTVAAQEQIVYELSQTLSTLMAQLKRKVTLRYSTANLSALQQKQNEFNSHVLGNGNEKIVSDANLTCCQQPLLLDVSNVSQTYANSQVTNANFVDISRKTLHGVKRDVTGTIVSTKPGIVTGVGHSFFGIESFQLLKSLLVTTVQWGPSVRMARQHLYNAIMTFLSTPGVSVDETALQRYYNALFDALVQDIAVPLCNENKLAAFALLSKLLHLSPRLCETLSMSLTGDSASPRLMTFVSSAFSSLDEIILTFFAYGGAEVFFILWFVQIVFDLLATIAQQHAIQLIQVNALSQCVSMKVWKASSWVISGNAGNKAGDSLLHSSETFEVYKELMKNIFLSSIRWFNVILPELDYSEVVLLPVAEFIRVNQVMFQNVFASLFVDSNRRLIDSLTLDLFAEISGLFYFLACSSLAGDLRELVHLFALPDVLVILTSSEFIETESFIPDATSTRMMLNLSLVQSQTGSLPSPRQRQKISVTVQKLAQFLLLTENLLPRLSFSGGFGGGGGGGGGGGICDFVAPPTSGKAQIQGAPCICDDARNMAIILTVTEQVVGNMEAIYNSQIFQVAYFTPYLMALHSLVLLAYSFLLSDNETHRKNVNSRWSFIVNVLEEAQRVVGLWKAFHSDYLKGLKITPVCRGQWDGAALSVSTRPTHPALTRGPEDEQQRHAITYLAGHVESTVNNKGEKISSLPPLPLPAPHAGTVMTVSALKDQQRTTTGGGGRSLANFSLSAVGGPPAACEPMPQPVTVSDSIGALVESAHGGDVLEIGVRGVHSSVRDEVLVVESLLRQVKVAISNALRAALRT